MWDDQFNSPFLSLFKRRGIEPVLVPQYFTVSLFLAGGVDACAAMHYNEYHRIYEAGVDAEEVTPLFMRDLGFGIPEDGLYCLESFYRKDPGACKAFAEASLEGWKRAAEDPGEAVSVVMRAARGSHVPANAAHTRWMLETILGTIIPRQGDTWKLGELSMEDYRRAADMLEEQGLIKRAPSYWTFRGEAPGRAE
jgi:NitT/TauT family transport system substrate-binding protein